MEGSYEPKAIQIEINTDCDLRCPFCPMLNVYRGRAKRHMPFEELKEVFERNFHKPHQTTFSGFAEAMLNPALWPMVEFEKARGNEVLLATNGTHLDAFNINRIVELGVDKVIATLDALEPEAYRRLRQGDVGTVIANLGALREAVEKAGAPTDIVLNYVVMRSTAAGMEPFISFMRANGFGTVMFIKIMGDARVRNAFVEKEHLSWEEYGALDFDRLTELAKEQGICAQRSDASQLRSSGCEMPEMGVYISADWEISCCPFLAQYPEFVFGNLKEQSISEIYGSQRFAELRSRLARGEWTSQCEECACLFSECGAPDKRFRGPS
jgi:radical SAM protein with 4Fe4S-binding SPASM domain